MCHNEQSHYKEIVCARYSVFLFNIMLSFLLNKKYLKFYCPTQAFVNTVYLSIAVFIRLVNEIFGEEIYYQKEKLYYEQNAYEMCKKICSGNSYY